MLWSNILGYTIIVVIFAIATFLLMKQHGPECPEMATGYGRRSEEISTLLSRLRWANSYKGRINYTLRYFVFAFIVFFLATVSAGGSFPSASRFFPAVLVVWCCLIALHNFFDHHVDKFGHYFVDRNSRLIERKIDRIEKKSLLLNPHKITFRPDGEAWGYVHTQ